MKGKVMLRNDLRRTERRKEREREVVTLEHAAFGERMSSSFT